MNKKLVIICIAAVLIVCVILLLLKSQNAKRGERQSNESAVSAPELRHATGGSGSQAGKEVPKAELIGKPAPATGQNDMPVSDTVKTILGEGNYVTKHKATKLLPDNLSSNDVAALIGFLETPLSNYPDMRQIDLNAIKNNVLVSLLEQEQVPENLGLKMVQMYGDPGTDEVWREYCMQYMETLYEKRSKERRTSNTELRTSNGEESGQSEAVRFPREFGADELTAIQDTMVAALDQHDGTLAGTALLGLETLSRNHPKQFDAAAVGDKALEIAADPNASNLNRLTAMRLAAQKGRAEVLPVARDLAVNGQTVMLQSAAIATLGDVGTADDLELLQSLSTSKNRQIAAIAKTSLKKIGNKQQ